MLTWLGGGLSQAANLLNDAVARAISLPDFVATLIGLRAPKRLRLRVVILRDERGEPLADEAGAAAAVARAAEILERTAAVHIEPHRPGALAVVADGPAPSGALDVGCTMAAWLQDLGAAGAYFRPHAAGGAAGTAFGYGTPLTIVVVRSIDRWSGCSIGPLANYVTVTAGTIRRGDGRTVAHELGHACLLFHRAGTDNLMAPARGTSLTRWQVAVIRSSSHVTFF